MKQQVMKFMLLFIILITGCHADQYTKRLAEDRLKGKQMLTVIEGYMELSYTENKGMVFGIMSDARSVLKTVLPLLLTCISILYIVFIVWRFRSRPFLHLLPFFIILSGAFANLFDRVIYGRVIDFIHIHFKHRLDWPFLFNVGDIFICMGAIFLLLLILFKKVDLEETIYHRTSNWNAR